MQTLERSEADLLPHGCGVLPRVLPALMRTDAAFPPKIRSTVLSQRYGLLASCVQVLLPRGWDRSDWNDWGDTDIGIGRRQLLFEVVLILGELESLPKVANFSYEMVISICRHQYLCTFRMLDLHHSFRATVPARWSCRLGIARDCTIWSVN